MVLCGRFGLGSGVLEIEPFAVPERTSDRPLLRIFGIEVEDAVGVEPDEDLCGMVF